MGIMKYCRTVMIFFFFLRIQNLTKKKTKLEFLEAIANTIVISWFTFEADKFTYSLKYINDNFWV